MTLAHCLFFFRIFVQALGSVLADHFVEIVAITRQPANQRFGLQAG